MLHIASIEDNTLVLDMPAQPQTITEGVFRA